MDQNSLESELKVSPLKKDILYQSKLTILEKKINGAKRKGFSFNQGMLERIDPTFPNKKIGETPDICPEIIGGARDILGPMNEVRKQFTLRHRN